MNIRQAILDAADHVEQQPDDYEFMRTDIPKHCGSPACALGWIAFFANQPSRTAHTASNEILGIDSDTFYIRMNALLGTDDWANPPPDDPFHDGNPELTAKGLRLYADEYHPEGEQQ